ncbi:hypothetical protein PV327_002529 [Microctonus hyperodae]|uniref:Probable arginine--tRNA ligase, mitochondrial n=1 Tax=Microctonus hyperodae TaxID=165561 RepID=A0AA39KPA3_MICHY|nr:hypothetical protein PV327_002529 [Microctonus hyperodae]
MSNHIRNLIYNKFFHNIDGNGLLPILSHLNLKCDAYNGIFAFHLPLKTNLYNIESKTNSLIQNNVADDIVRKIDVNKNNQDELSVDLNRNTFVKNILELNSHEISPPTVICSNKNVVVDFSSPNIAKPFHVGHLRSTIIGNYIANLHKFIHNNVTKINYLGDWGTQFGLVKLGMDLRNIADDKIKTDPIKELYEAYVYANKLSESDTNIIAQARNIFHQLESGDVNFLEQWEVFKKYTVEELERTYNRIGITFDEYNWESQYNANKISDIINYMKELKLLKKDVEGRQVIALNKERNLPIIKSDGSTLYITRDIAAAIDRAEKYNFDKMYYVVDTSQVHHFNNLITILNKMEMPWANKLEHVKFGKIRGMSTRKGDVVFLTDILDEANATMKEKQIKSPTTKVDLNSSETSSDILGISAIICYDMKQRKLRDYEFNWDVALDIKGETGVRLQYTHCRLVSLEENCGVKLPSECDPSLLKEPIVNELVAAISQFDEAVVSSYQTLEPCHLLKYLFHLSHTVNKALKELRVKSEPEDVASQRLLLFHVAKNVLNTGMKLIGLVPLNKM